MEVSTDRQVAALEPRVRDYSVKIKDRRGAYVVVRPSGRKSFIVIARQATGKTKKVTLPVDVGIKAVKRQVDAIKDEIKAEAPKVMDLGKDPASYGAAWRIYVERHVVKKGLRTRDQLVRLSERYILPALARLPIEDVNRSLVHRLCDRVGDTSGERTAERVGGLVQQVLKFHAKRHDSYISPLFSGWREIEKRPRTRKFDDAELRKILAAAAGMGVYGSVILMLVLTGARKGKVASMKWSDVSDDGIWTIANEAREKVNAGELPLPAQAQAIIRRQPRHSEFVFAGARGGPWTRWAPYKSKLDRLCGVHDWVLHDLRAVARSLMARAGISEEIGERTLGHRRGAIIEVYNRHDHTAEKAAALKALAAEVAKIMIGPIGGGNIEALHRG